MSNANYKLFTLGQSNTREYLHYLLDIACDRCKESDFVAAHFVQVCMEEEFSGGIKNKYYLKKENKL